ncbi:MAG: hypothetical protein C0506_08820 [Anaerolinea sp.]|nr:hypothetical protein [Anaerolinea sp.]
MAAGCGDGSDGSASTAAVGPEQPQALTAADLIPDLAALGFTKGQSERDPAALPGQDAHRALYQQQAAPQMAARVDITVLPSAADATKQWETLSQAMRNPPPDLFGGNSTQKDTAATNVGDQSKAYVTAKPDTNGAQVWTDVYRFGRAVAVVQVLSRNEAEGQKARTAIAGKILEKAK